MLTDRPVRRGPFCLPAECLMPEHSLLSSSQLRLPSQLGWRAHGGELQVPATMVLVRLSREVRATQTTQKADLPHARIGTPGQNADVRVVLCLSVSVNLEPPLSFFFRFLLGFLPLSHWCGCCFLATICVTCMSWSYLIGG